MMYGSPQRSARGRGGGRFVNTCRGRGGRISSKKWVRPTSYSEQKEDSSTTTTTTKTGIEDSGSSPSQSVSQRNVILKGPTKRYLPPTRPNTARNQTWKRKPDESKSDGGATPTTTTKTEEKKKETFPLLLTIVQDQSSSVDSGSEDHISHDANDVGASSSGKPETSATAECPTQMVRRGKHKLVSQHSKAATSSSSSSSRAQSSLPEKKTLQQSNASTLSTAVAAKGELHGDDSFTVMPALPMRKRGRNKLVLDRDIRDDSSILDMKQSLEKPGESVHQGASERMRDATDVNQHSLLYRMGNNKLDTQSVDEDRTRIQGKWHHNQHRNSVPHLQSSRGRGRGKAIASWHGVKRIKLNPPSASGDSTAAAAAAPADGSGEEIDGTAAGAATEKYTEFAYRQSSTVSHRGRGRGRGVKGRGGSATTARGRNMGLVRVEPDAATTRICPTYLRGEPCTNPTCGMRHDVPKEAAIPICSFFQRNGLCNKGDACPFRHIKVNPHATICPSFSLLGFCENEHCVMKHIRAPKNKQRP